MYFFINIQLLNYQSTQSGVFTHHPLADGTFLCPQSSQQPRSTRWIFCAFTESIQSTEALRSQLALKTYLHPILHINAGAASVESELMLLAVRLC